jgi:hypothetical protein
MRNRLVSIALAVALSGCASAPTGDGPPTSSVPAAHACPECRADLSPAVHEQCPRCRPDRWWTHATKAADAPPARPMSVRCPSCAREATVDVQAE